MTMGSVSLVGAGPGDPELLTIRALRRLRAADLVLHDVLVGRSILRLARRAECREVGGRCGAHRLSQEAVSALMIEAARAGLRVVRLKGGDPFVFGRGGEETRALAAAGVPFEVVPGITSVAAAPALAGIPLTYRGVAASFTVLHGHDPAAWPSLVASVAPSGTTLVVLMGLASRAALAESLLGLGWPSQCPAAIVLNASTASAHVWKGTIGDLGRAPISPERDGPGVIVIGDVVGLAVQLEAGSGTWQPSMIQELSAALA
jgi:uroporphyrin-III C-methyltransferase